MEIKEAAVTDAYNLRVAVRVISELHVDPMADF